MSRISAAPELDANLPPLTAVTVILATMLEAMRDQNGMVECAQNGIGKMRRILGPVASAELDDLTEGEKVRDQSRLFMANLCRVCTFPDCPMKSWPISN